MNDLEICKRIAEIEGLNYECNEGLVMCWLDNSLKKWQQPLVIYDPINDDALCFGLLKKYDVELQITKERDKVDISRGKYPKQYYAKIGRVEVMDKVIERAILLAIIESRKS